MDGTIETKALRPQGQCPLCHDALDAAGGLSIHACQACGTRYHRECFDELGGCATLGCARGVAAPRRVTRVSVRGGTPRQGPVPGRERDCVRCGARFLIRARAPHNPRCESCHRRYRVLWTGVIIAVWAAYAFAYSMSILG